MVHEQTENIRTKMGKIIFQSPEFLPDRLQWTYVDYFVVTHNC